MPKRQRISKKRQRRPRRRQRRTRRKQRGGGGAAVVFVLTQNAGFFSTFFFLCKAYLYAKGKGVPFFLEHNKWQYTADKGWHDYFTTCEVYDPSKGYESVEKFQHGQVTGIPEYTAGEYSEACQALFKPRPELVQAAERFRAGMGGPYTALYVRRGDKVREGTKEMELLPIQKILDSVDIKDDGRRLFVQTDDYTVVEEVQAARPSLKIHTQTPKEDRGATHGSIVAMSPEQKRKHTEEFITSILVFQGGEPAWTDIRSNLGRFEKLLAFEIVQGYPKEESGASITRDRRVKAYESFNAV